MNRYWYDQLTEVCAKGCAYFSRDLWPDGNIHPVCHYWGYRLDDRRGIADGCDDWRTASQVEEERRQKELLLRNTKKRKKKDA